MDRRGSGWASNAEQFPPRRADLGNGEPRRGGLACRHESGLRLGGHEDHQCTRGQQVPDAGLQERLGAVNTNTRRGFVKASLAGAAATLATLPVRSQQAAKRPLWTGPMPASIMCYSFFGLHREGKMDVFGFLETCKYRYSLQAGDLWSGFLTSTDESYFKKIREAYDEREMVCPQLAVDGANVWDADPDVREKNYRNALTYLKANTILGAKFVRFDAGGATQDKQWSDEAFDHIVKRYREYCQFASDHGS